MTSSELLARLRLGPMLLDGGVGTALQSMGLPLGCAPERWLIEYPDRIRQVHSEYERAGSDLVHTVTFGANPVRLAATGLEGRCRDINIRAVCAAREAVRDRVIVAGDVGPTGLFLPPAGDATEEQVEDAFRVQCEHLASSGADLISIETMYCAREAMAAVHAASATGLAVLCSMTFVQRSDGPATFLGDPVVESLSLLWRAGATVVGCNCTEASNVMVGMAEFIRNGLGEAPIVMQPNGGQPVRGLSGVRYQAFPWEFARNVVAMFDAGVSMVGGCCGVSVGMVRAARDALDERARSGFHRSHSGFHEQAGSWACSESLLAGSPT